MNVAVLVLGLLCVVMVSGCTFLDDVATGTKDTVEDIGEGVQDAIPKDISLTIEDVIFTGTTAKTSICEQVFNDIYPNRDLVGCNIENVDTVYKEMDCVCVYHEGVI